MKMLPLFVAALVGALFMFFVQPDPVPRYDRVVVTDTLIMKEKPDTVVRFVERIKWRTVTVTQVATAPEAALPEVNAFCSAAGWVVPGDTVPPEPAAPRLLLTAGSYNGKELRQWGVLSNGDAWSADHRVRAPMRWTVSGDSLFVQGDRWAVWRMWGERAVWLAGGLLVGELMR